MAKVRLDRFDNRWYSPVRPFPIRLAWFLVGLPLLRSPLNPSSALRAILLRIFGARLGRGVVLKPGIRVKYPWLLSIGDHSWVGEDCWIDNLAPVAIGSHVCVSQGAYLCTGNHDWSDPAFGLILGPVTLRDGAWVGARAVICPGVELGECAVAAAGSIVTKSIPPFEIHAGNPASFVRTRTLRDSNSTSLDDPADQSVLRS